MMLNCSHRRPGFTLLEVLLASAIGLILLAALYAAFDMVLRQTESGRTVSAQSDLARAIISRMSQDLPQSLGPLPPKSGGGVSGSTSSSIATASSTTATTTATTVSETATTDPAAAADAAAAAVPASESESGADVPFQGGVFGTDKQLSMYLSRVPKDLVNRNAAAQTLGGATPSSDLRRVTYYLSATGGLCRQEQLLVTADGIRNSTNPDHAREAQDLIADEVTDVTFEYFDGTGWTSSWTGDDTTEDGKNVVGPPRAIRMTLVIADEAGGTKTVQHTFVIRTAVGSYVAPTASTTTATTTTGGM